MKKTIKIKANFNKKIALFGGVGPWASAHAHYSIIRKSQWYYGAVNDDEYPRILHISEAIRGFDAEGIKDKDEVHDQIIETFDLFKNWGADLAIIACNSLHEYHNELTDRTGINIIHLPEMGAKEVASRGIKKAGFLCSESALKAGLHKTALENHGIEVVSPTENQQKRTTKIIEMIMGGDSSIELAQEYIKLGREFKEAGAEVIVSGCTEISWLGSKVRPDIPEIDCLAEAITETLKLASTTPRL